jgi:hypothetical protein
LSKPLKPKEASMSFHFHNQPFWGLLVMSPERDNVVAPVSHPLFRTRLIARWVRAADGRLERHWHRQPITFQPD